MNERIPWPPDPTAEDIERLTPTLRDLARLCLPATLTHIGPPTAPPPLPAELALVIVAVLADNPVLQELGEDEFLDFDEAIDLAEELLAVLRHHFEAGT